MVDIDFLLLVGLEADRHVSKKFAPTSLHEKSIDALVGGAVACAQREKTPGVEGGVAYRRRRLRAIPNPSQAFRKIAGMPAFNSATIEFAEHTAPVPLAYLFFGADLLPTVAKFCKNSGKRHELRLVRQVAIQEDMLQSKQLCSPEKAGQHMVAERL